MDFKKTLVLNAIGLKSANDCPDRDPANFIIYGTVDGEEITLKEVQGESFSDRFETKIYYFDNGKSVSVTGIHLKITKTENS
jgi:hypothetical protein